MTDIELHRSVHSNICDRTKVCLENEAIHACITARTDTTRIVRDQVTAHAPV